MQHRHLGTGPSSHQRQLTGIGLAHSQLVNQARFSKARQRLATQDVIILETARMTGVATMTPAILTPGCRIVTSRLDWLPPRTWRSVMA